MFKIFNNVPSVFPHWFYHFYYPTNNIWGFQILHIFVVQTVQNLWWLDLWFFHFMMVLWILNFDLFPDLQYSVLYSRDAMQFPINNMSTRTVRTVCCVASLFWILCLCFNISYLCETPICISRFWWEGKAITLEMKLK